MSIDLHLIKAHRSISMLFQTHYSSNFKPFRTCSTIYKIEMFNIYTICRAYRVHACIRYCNIILWVHSLSTHSHEINYVVMLHVFSVFSLFLFAVTFASFSSLANILPCIQCESFILPQSNGSIQSTLLPKMPKMWL